MIQVRKENPVFVYGEYDVIQEDHPDVYVYTRNNGRSVCDCFM